MGVCVLSVAPLLTVLVVLLRTEKVVLMPSVLSVSMLIRVVILASQSMSRIVAHPPTHTALP